MSTQPGHVSPSEHVDAGLHATLRFATGVTLVFLLCEAMQWAPTFLAPVLAVVLLGNLPMRPTPKVALVLIAAMLAAALYAFVLTSLFRGTPLVLFGLIALSLFLSFHAMLSGRPSLPFMLLLICLATIPVVAMIAPAQGSVLPIAMVRGIAVALAMIGLVYLPWPRVPAPTPKPPASAHEATPLMRALLSTFVVLPVMLVYLLFGLADVLPVLVTTVMLVINFDLQSGRSQAVGMILGNFVGGLLGLLLHTALLTTPSLTFLGLLLFVVLLGFGQRIVAGGPMAGVAVVTCNAMLIILSSAIASGTGSLALWLTRVFQFALAGAFAVGMMHLVWHRALARRAAPPSPVH